MGFEDSMNITYRILDHIFEVQNDKNVPVKQIIHCLVTLPKKSKNDIALKAKKPQMILRNYIQISQKKGKKKSLLVTGMFSAKIQYILQKTILVLKMFCLTMGVFLIINDYYRTNIQNYAQNYLLQNYNKTICNHLKIAFPNTKIC